jgi:hypothetical protein
MVGFRVRLKDEGGCVHTTFGTVLSVLVKAFAIESLCVLVMAIIVYLWHAW